MSDPKAVFRSFDAEVLDAYREFDVTFNKWKADVIEFSEEVVGKSDAVVNNFLGNVCLVGFRCGFEQYAPAGWRRLPRDRSIIVPIRNHKKIPAVITRFASLRNAPRLTLPGMPNEVHVEAELANSSSHSFGCKMVRPDAEPTMFPYVEVSWGVVAERVDTGAEDSKFDAGKWEPVKLSEWYAEQGL